MFTYNKMPSLAGRRVAPVARSGLAKPAPRLAPLYGSCGRSLKLGSFSSLNRFSKRTLRDVRLNEADFRRRAELDYVDYRDLNGIVEEQETEESPDVDPMENGYAELDRDVEELESAAPRPGFWRIFRGPRALFAYLSNPEELGKRGEGLFLVTLLVAVFAFFPPVAIRGCLRVIGWGMTLAGIATAIAGVVSLGSSFSPFAVPKTDAVFVARGIFRYVRHPLYAGIFFIALGSGLATGNEFRLLLTAVLYWILDETIRGEEKDLERAYPEYADYKEKVAKFVPYVF